VGSVSVSIRGLSPQAGLSGLREPGAVAALVTPVFAIVSGGVATVLVVIAGLRLFPRLRRLGSLTRISAP